MTLVLEIPAAAEERLRREAERQGVSIEEYVLQRVMESPEAGPASESDTGSYLLGLAEAFRTSIPEEEWNRLPADYATNYKEYLRKSRGGEAG